MLSITYKINDEVITERYDSVDDFNQKFNDVNHNIIEIAYIAESSSIKFPSKDEFDDRLYSNAELYYVNEVKTYDKPHGAKLSHSQLNQFFNVEAPKYDSLEQVEGALRTLYMKNNIEFTSQGLKQVISNYKKRVNLTKQAQNKAVTESTLSAEELKKREQIVKSMKKNFKAFKRKYGDDAKSVMYATATSMAKD